MGGTEDTKTLITLSFPNEEFEFVDTDELREFMQEQRQAWNWIPPISQQESPISSSWSVLNNYLSQVNSFLSEYERHADNENQQKNLVTTLVNQTKTAVSNGLILRDSPEAKFVDGLREQGKPVVAAYALAIFMRQKFSVATPEAFEGGFWALQFQFGSTDTVTAEREALDAMKRSWSIKFGKQHKNLRTQNDELIAEVDGLRTQYEELVKALENQKQEQEASFNEKLETGEKRLSDIERTYDEKLALQSSVKYWTEKRAHHQVVMWIILAVTILLAAGTGGGFVYAARTLLQETITAVPLWKLGVMLAISTFGVWITRLSAKIFISNLHLRTDADERVTMIQTYLALLRDGEGPKEEERQLILQTLFRPSTSGFIKDEGPAGFYEAMSKTLGK